MFISLFTSAREPAKRSTCSTHADASASSRPGWLKRPPSAATGWHARSNLASVGTAWTHVSLCSLSYANPPMASTVVYKDLCGSISGTCPRSRAAFTTDCMCGTNRSTICTSLGSASLSMAIRIPSRLFISDENASVTFARTNEDNPRLSTSITTVVSTSMAPRLMAAHWTVSSQQMYAMQWLASPTTSPKFLMSHRIRSTKKSNAPVLYAAYPTLSDSYSSMRRVPSRVFPSVDSCASSTSSLRLCAAVRGIPPSAS